ncbi:MAG TPA: hypothetical protein VK698_32520, partial [Kofleriaceae bacterium]|nr:hypothetical protein [Kofleriaceae bacterium]
MRFRKPTKSAASLACLILWSQLAASCRTPPPGGQVTKPAAGVPTAVDQVLVQLKDAPPGLAVRLSDGKPGGAGRADR